LQSSNGQCLRSLRTLTTQASVKLSTGARTLTRLEVTPRLQAAGGHSIFPGHKLQQSCTSLPRRNHPIFRHRCSQNKRRCEQIAHTRRSAPLAMIFQPERTHCCRLQRRAFDNTKTNSAPAFETSERIDAAVAAARRKTAFLVFLFAADARRHTCRAYDAAIMIMQRSPSREASAAALVINNIRAAALNMSAGRKKFERRVHVRLQLPRFYSLVLQLQSAASRLVWSTPHAAKAEPWI
jgi:hypothetical protein